MGARDLKALIDLIESAVQRHSAGNTGFATSPSRSDRWGEAQPGHVGARDLKVLIDLLERARERAV